MEKIPNFDSFIIRFTIRRKRKLPFLYTHTSSGCSTSLRCHDCVSLWVFILK